MIKMIPLLLLFIIPLNIYSFSYQDDEKILLLNSYHPQYKWTKDLTNEITSQLENHVAKENIFVEYLDGRRFIDDQEYIQRLKSFLQFKYSKSNLPSLVITTDDFAFQFMLNFGEIIFPETPVAFGGVNIFNEDMLIGKPNFTGVLEGYEFKKNIELIEKLHPKINELFILSDKSSIGSSLTRELMKTLNNKKYKITLLSETPFNKMQDILMKSNPSNAALILAIHKDENGRYFSYSKDLPELGRFSNIPIYGMWGVNNGLGTIGGYMTDAKTHAKEITFKALELLQIGKPNYIPIIKNTLFIPQFDYKVLKRFDIDISKLPTDSIILDRPQTFYQIYQREINLLILVFVSLLGVIGFLQHLVRRKTKELSTLNDKMKEFIAIVVHDIRNPIGNILSLTDLLNEDPDEAKDLIPSIQKSANKSLKLVDDILQISAIESGKIKIIREEMNLKELFDDLITELSPFANKKELTLTHNLNNELIINGDYYRLNQVLQNLITNSIKFCKPHGTVELLAEVKEGEVTIKVQDNGIGMPKEMVKDLYNKNENVSRSGTAGESGTGYGLPLVYELVRLHDSNLKCKSDEGKGTVFSFELPTKSAA